MCVCVCVCMCVCVCVDINTHTQRCMQTLVAAAKKLTVTERRLWRERGLSVSSFMLQ